MKPLTYQSRHPLCPECGYDLAATVEANHRVCPECGEAFELGDLRYAPRPDDWTLGRGLRRLAAVLAVRMIVIAATIGIIMLLLEAATARMAGMTNPFVGLGLLLMIVVGLIVLGYGVGRAISYRLVDIAGIGGLTVAIVAALFALGSLAFGVWISHLIQPYQEMDPRVILFLTCIASLIPIVRTAILDEL